MSDAVHTDSPAADATGRRRALLLGGAALCLVAAGALLWWREGDAVFTSLVTAALAWCL